MVNSYKSDHVVKLPTVKKRVININTNSYIRMIVFLRGDARDGTPMTSGFLPRTSRRGA